MTDLVVDASCAVKWFFDEEHTEEALELLDDRFTLHAPGFLKLEADNVVVKRVRRKLITRREGAGVREAMGRMPIRFHEVELLRDPAYEIAVATGCAVYDCLYVALGELLDGPVVTDDKRLIGCLRAAGVGRRAIWVGDLGSVSGQSS